MAIRRPSKPNKDDFMSNAMDKRLEELEEEISAIYTLASEDATENLDNYLTAFEKAKEKMYARYIEGEISEQEYREWLENMIVRREEYQAMISSLTDILTNADIAAMALVEGELPYVIAQSYDFGQFVGSLMADREGMDHVSFRIYNADSVQAIIRDNPDLIPMVDVPVDQVWNRTHLRRELTASIINGDSIPDVARRLMRITSMDRNAAIRNARTAMTAGENLGRNESYNRIRSQGIEMVKEWSATYDSRTRDTHRLLNGTRANEKGLFGEGILDSLGEPLMEFPGDPKGAAAEIYNCRCRLNIVPPNYSREANAQAYERWMQENYPADYRALNEDNYFDRLHKTDEWTAEAQRRVDRRIERLRTQQTEINDAVYGTNYEGRPYTRQEYEDRLKELNEFGKYHYHATTIGAINGIKRDGLKPSRGHAGEGVYMARTADSALEWTESTSTGGNIVLRVSNEFLARTDYSNIERGIHGEGFTERIVPSEYIEIRLPDGSWVSIQDVVISWMRGIPHVIRKPRGR